MQKAQIGIIGGSGLYKIEEMEKIKGAKIVSINTPFGKPSDNYVIGTIENKTVAFLPRHGVGHKILPTEINSRANIYGFKKLGVEKIIAVSAVGSLKEEIQPLDIVIPHQFFCRTTKRNDTFFGEGIAAHITFAHPVCIETAQILYEAAKKIGINVHWGGTYLNMEGPAFSTKSESYVYRQWGMDVIGMTNIAEAKLSREAEICYTTLALVTDYDCWHPKHESVTVDMIIRNLMKNISNARKILDFVLPKLPSERKCACKDALKNAIVTDKKFIPEKTKKKLKLIIGKYI